MSSLWKVTLVGASYFSFNKEFYVVSDSSDSAYDIVIKDLSKNYIGRSHELVLDKVELIAKTEADFKYGTKLYLQNKVTITPSINVTINAEELIAKVKNSQVHRSIEQTEEIMIKANIIDNNGDYSSDFFSEETIQKGREARLAKENKQREEE